MLSKFCVCHFGHIFVCPGKSGKNRKISPKQKCCFSLFDTFQNNINTIKIKTLYPFTAPPSVHPLRFSAAPKNFLQIKTTKIKSKFKVNSETLKV